MMEDLNFTINLTSDQIEEAIERYVRSKTPLESKVESVSFLYNEDSLIGADVRMVPSTTVIRD